MVATGSSGYGVNFLKGSLYRSTDYGATWQQAAGNTLYYWQRIAMSDTGQYMLASSLNGPLFLSSNYGASYTDITSRIKGNATEYFEGVGMSGDGKYIIVCYEEPGGFDFSVKISNNYGAVGSWSYVSGFQSTENSVQGVAISNDGQYMYLSYSSGGIAGNVVRSTNYGATWQTVGVGTQYVRDISCSSDGSTVVVTGATRNYSAAYLTRGFMFKSTNYGASYSSIQTGDYLRNWARVGQLYTNTSPSGYGTVMVFYNDQRGEVTWPAETYQYDGESLGSVVTGGVSGMGQRIFTDYAVGGTNGPYRLIGSTTGLFRSTNGGGTWTQL
jgi:WD40 repeat protein